MSGADLCHAPATQLAALIRAKKLSPLELTRAVLEREWNPEYHAVIREFERRTGVGAVLNTSFNLHGEPIVGSAADAVDTFERSGLPHLAVGHWLLSKK